MSHLLRTFRILFLSLAALGLVWAQTETGQIAGTVTDPAGATVAGAAVTVTNTQTGAMRTATSSGAGDFTITNLQPGEYNVAVAANGFASFQQKVVLNVGAKVGVDVRLQLATTSTSVTVSESAVEVNTETQTLSQTIDSRQMVDLPNLSRNPYAFVTIAGNVSDGGTMSRGVGVSINGQRESSTNILLDGASNNDEFTTNVGQVIPLDAVQEFSVITSDFTAEYGRASGGIVNVAVKQGTNAFHGTVYEFNRVSALSSNFFQNNAYGIPKSPFTRNQFGYSLGGPIKKDKLFFFSSTEWLRVRSNDTVTAWVPTPQLISLLPANAQSFFQQLGGLRSSAASLGTASLSQIQAINGDPTICSTGACSAIPANTPLFEHVGYSAPADAGGGVPENTYMTVLRVDYNMSDRTQMYGDYALYSELDTPGSLANSPYSGYDLGQNTFDNRGLFSITHSFSPAFTEQSKVVFNRLNNLQQGLTSQRGLVPTMYGSVGALPQIGSDSVVFPGYNPFTPGNGGAFGGPQNYAQIYQDFSISHGKHDFRFGGSYDYIRDNRTYAAYQTAVDGLSAHGDITGTLNALLAGTFHDIQVAVYPQGKYPCVSAANPTPSCEVTLPVGSPNFSRSNRYNEGAFYGQDSWKVKPTFTLNLGLRWEYFGVQHNKNASLDSNWYGTTVDQATTDLYGYIADGNLMPTPQSPIGELWKPDYHDFAPRVGFAWDVMGDGKTSLRGGYGIGYERNFGNVTFNLIQNPPNYAVLDEAGAITTNNYGPLGGSNGTLPLGKTGARIVNPDIKTAYAHTWSAALEHKFGNSVVYALEYSGSKGVNLYSISYPNEAGYGNLFTNTPCDGIGTGANGGVPCVGPRTTQYSSGIGFRGNQGFSLYNGLNNRLQIRNVGNTGVDLTLNYTWSHAIDNLSSTFFETNSTLNNGDFEFGLFDPYNPAIDKGSADFDIRQRVSFAGSWRIPAGHHGRIYDAVIGGWELNPVFTARTGEPFSIFDSTNGINARITPRATFTTAPVPNASLTPDPTTPDTFAYMNIDPATIVHVLNPFCNCADLPFTGSGMTGRNAFRAPGFFDLDLGVNKNVTIKEGMSLQLRGESFNALNHANFYVNGGNADMAQTNTIIGCYGCTGATVDRRNIQLAAKLIF